MSSESFADLGVSRPVVGALAEHGFTEPFAVQRLAIADVLNGDDVLVQSPTGSGKTLASACRLSTGSNQTGPVRRPSSSPQPRARRADRRGHPPVAHVRRSG